MTPLAGGWPEYEYIPYRQIGYKDNRILCGVGNRLSSASVIYGFLLFHGIYDIVSTSG